VKVSIFGLGYVGCVSMACISEGGHTVIGVDKNKTKVDLINAGKSPIIEKDLDRIILEQHKLGKISATIFVKEAIMNSEVSIVCVGTPSTPNGHLDMSAIMRVSEDIGKALSEKDEFHVVAIRSTVYPGSVDAIIKCIENVSKKNHNKDFTVIANPEFLREGTALKDYYSPSYILMSGSIDEGIEKLKLVYKNVNAPVIVAEIGVVELIKHISNTFHALKITFANEVGGICNKLSINSLDLMNIFCLDNKLNISTAYLKPGFAFGGSCLPKDLKALSAVAHDQFLECPVLESINKSNESLKLSVLNQIIAFGKNRIAFLGMSFKAGTDDMRGSPIIGIIEQLIGKGFDVRIFDRNIKESQLIGANKEEIYLKIPFIFKFLTVDPDQIIRHADIVVVVNRDEEYKDILNKVSPEVIIFDLVDINFDARAGLKNYVGIAW
jgi:GDP-mannose 6-dehydrogenase